MNRGSDVWVSSRKYQMRPWTRHLGALDWALYSQLKRAPVVLQIQKHVELCWIEREQMEIML